MRLIRLVKRRYPDGVTTYYTQEYLKELGYWGIVPGTSATTRELAAHYFEKLVASAGQPDEIEVLQTEELP